MAEFQEVMRQITRYCNSQNGCASCELSKITDDHCPSDLFADDNGANIENEVMSWAAEHPEPVYPTWAEFLHEAFCEKYPMPYRGDAAWYAFLRETTIPTDIARKMGLQPKEG